MDEITSEEVQRGVLNIFYEGPWDRLMNWLYGIDRKTNEIRTEIKDDGIRSRLAGWAEARHFAWIDRYIRAGKNPPDRWKRSVLDPWGRAAGNPDYGKEPPEGSTRWVYWHEHNTL